MRAWVFRHRERLLALYAVPGRTRPIAAEGTLGALSLVYLRPPPRRRARAQDEPYRAPPRPKP
jgi:hypothetical protein